MIKTKYIYTPKETSDGTRILIARKWPRGRSKLKSFVLGSVTPDVV